MPRAVAMRVSYREDAAHLLRLQGAVQKDTGESEEWKNEVAGLLLKASQKLIEAEGRRTGRQVTARTRARKSEAQASK